MLRIQLNITGWSALILSTIHKYHGSEIMAMLMGGLAVVVFVSVFFIKE